MGVLRFVKSKIKELSLAACKFGAKFQGLVLWTKLESRLTAPQIESMTKRQLERTTRIWSQEKDI